jgi:Flagellar biogenesis protein
MKPYEVILFLLGFGSILFLSYVTTRYLAGKTNKAMKGRHLNVIETLSLGTDKRIHLIRAGEQYILIASTSKSIEFLTTLDLDTEIQPGVVENPNKNYSFDFKAIFEKYLTNYKNKKEETVKADISNPLAGDKFRFNLYKLKDITQKINYQVKKDEVDNTNEE